MDWKYYPDNQPKKTGEYLVAITEFVTIARFENNSVMYDENGEKYYGPAWHDIINGGFHFDVIAFMEKPKFNKDK